MKNGDDPARKRSRGDSESGSGPASKMSRVLGTSVETESQFLQNVGSASSSSHHSLKSSKKVQFNLDFLPFERLIPRSNFFRFHLDSGRIETPN